MSAPVVVTVRPGVTLTPAAGASFRRVEAWLGRRADVNSTYRDWNKQWGMYTAWNAYVAGRGPRPKHSRAIHPDLSKHCQGLALDSDDWRTPGFNALMAEHGWVRTAAGDPTEQHHFEYQWWRDQHRNEPAGGNGTPIIEEEDDMQLLYLYFEGDTGAKGVIGTINRAFRTPLERSHFLNVWGTEAAPKNGAKIGSVVTSPAFVAQLLTAHTNVDVIAETVAKVIPAVTGGSSAAEVATLVDAILKDDFAAVVNAIPTEATITLK